MLQDDCELTSGDVQELSHRAALAVFFAKPGYNTNERLAQNAGAMNLNNDLLRTSLTHIERLAGTGDGLTEEEIRIVGGKG